MSSSIKPLFQLLSFLFFCLLNQSCTIEDLPIYRVRVQIDTSNKTNAQTNDLLYVQLTSSSEKVYLDYARDDFEKNDSDYYDVTFKDIYQLKDITRLKIAKSGTNGVCIQRIRLYINNNVLMFDQNYGNSGCKWLDNSGSHRNYVSFSSSTLRENSNWNITSVDLNYPEQFSSSTLENIIEGIVGNELHQDDIGLRWGYKTGREYVTVTRSSSNAHNVDLDLKYESSYVNSRGRTKEIKFSVDVDFQLRWQCIDNEFIMETRYMDVDIELEKGPFWIRVVDYLVSDDVVDYLLDSNIAEMDIMKGISRSLGECPDSFNVKSNGTLEMTWPPMDLSSF